MSAVLQAQEPGARYLAAVPPALVRQFELLATAPGGVGRLRELILALAIQGKLVPQSPADEPAAFLLGRIESAKQQLITVGAMKRFKLQASISVDELPFPTPTGWQWVRLGSLLKKIGAGSTPLGGKEVYTATGVKFLRSQNVWNDGLRLDGVAYISPLTHAQMAGTIVVANDLLFNITGASIGRCAVVPADFDEANVSQHVTIIRPVLPSLNAFLHIALISRFVQQAVMEVQVGVSREGLSIAKLGNFLVPMPPLAEQARIVARVDELMRLCDALEAQGRLEAEQHARLLGTLLGTLTDSSTPEELAANWQRVADHFDLLLDRPEAVDALEQTILQLAVRGLLVQQDPKEGAASDFLQRLHAKRRQLGSENKGRRVELRSPIENGPYELPSGWFWTTIEDLADVGTGSTPSRDNAAFFTGGTIPWVTSGETGQPFIRTTSQHVTEAALASTSLTLYPVGTLIVAMYGQGKTRGQVSELCLEATTNQACAAVVLLEKSAPHRDFVKLVFEKSYDEIREHSAGGAQPNLNVGKVKASLIPLPPLAEQARIVGKVAELRRFCAALRQRLTASRTTQSQLAEALVESAAA